MLTPLSPSAGVLLGHPYVSLQWPPVCIKVRHVSSPFVGFAPQRLSRDYGSENRPSVAGGMIRAGYSCDCDLGWS